MVGQKTYPVTPDGKYFVVRGRLWRTSNPALPSEEKAVIVAELMVARRAVGASLRAGDRVAEVQARALVDVAKRKLGERGPVWWVDGAPDMNRQLIKMTPYAEWFSTDMT
jgi:hypothetical protein